MAKDTTNLYLSKIKPDPNFGQSLVGRYLTNVRLVTLLVLTIVILGIVSFITLPRRLNPEVQIPLITVNTVLPGASPEDVESLVTIPIEDSLESLEDVTSITSTSPNNISIVTVEFESSVDPDDARTDVQAAVDTVTDLPEDALDPDVIQLDFENQPVWTFAITTTQDTASLMRFARIVQDQLEDDSSIKEVTLAGLEEQEIQVLIKPEIADELGLNPFQLNQAVNDSLQSFPAGTINSATNNFSVTIDPQVTDIDELRNVQVNLSDNLYQLQDLADISFAPTPNQTPAFVTQDNQTARAVTMAVFKSSSADINAAQDKAETLVNQLAEGKDQFQIINIENAALEIEDQFNELASNFVTTILLVFGTLLLFLGLRQALVASISIPLTFLISFTIMQALGITLNFLSLFSLLLALGLVVDDAIVIISAMTTYHRTGRFSAKESGFLVWKDFIVPIWSTTITTIWAFVPLLLSSGIIGEFIKSIPVVVTATLLSSTSVAVLINLPLMIVLLNPKVPRRVRIAASIILLVSFLALAYFLLPASPLQIPTLLAIILLIAFLKFFGPRLADKFFTYSYPQRVKAAVPEKRFRQVLDTGFVNTQRLKKGYHRILTRIINSKPNRRRTIAFVVIFALFAYILVPLGFVQNEFFPSTEGDRVYLEAEYPSGTNNPTLIAGSEEIAVAYLTDLTDVDYYTTQFGRRAPTFDQQATSPNYILYTLNLVEENDRSQNSIDFANDLRQEVASYTGLANLTVSEQSGGPPVGADVQILLLGDDLEVLDGKANEVIAFLEQNPNLANVQKSVQPGVSKLSFIPDYAQLSQEQINPSQIGLSLRNYITGFEYDDITIDDQTFEIIYRSGNQLQTTDTLNQLSLPTPDGNTTLGSLGDFVLNPNPTIITREDGQRTISVTAAAVGDVPAPAINAELETFADGDLQLPPGYSWKTGGANEENQESVNSILQAMLVAALLILITMVVQLQSFRKAIIVLLVIPLATSGVFILFGLFGIPLSFPALIGVLALFGIVVNNSIMIVEKINQNLNIGLKLKESVIDASTSRLEPIMLSSLTTIMGLLPITISDPLWRGLGGAIIAGLTFSGIIMLFFIPTVYYAIYQKEYK